MLQKCLFCVFSITVLSSFSSFLFAESSPVLRSELEKRLKIYVKGGSNRDIIKTEYPGGSYSQFEKGLFIYPQYAQPIYFYWEGSYGQVVKELVYFTYIKTNNVWVYNNSIPGSIEETKMVKQPTKKLPDPPAEPGKDAVKTILDNYSPEPMSRVVSYTYEIISMSKPEFTWQGFDFQNAVYIYRGKVRYTKRRHSGGLLTNMLGGNKEKKECDFEVTMTYLKDRSQIVENERLFPGGWIGNVRLDLKNAK